MRHTYWNYRVVREKSEEEFVFTICEVYYLDGKVSSWSSMQTPHGDSLEDLTGSMQRFHLALSKPVLEEVINDLEWTLKEV